MTIVYASKDVRLLSMCLSSLVPSVMGVVILVSHTDFARQTKKK